VKVTFIYQEKTFFRTMYMWKDVIKLDLKKLSLEMFEMEKIRN